MRGFVLVIMVVAVLSALVSMMYALHVQQSSILELAQTNAKNIQVLDKRMDFARQNTVQLTTDLLKLQQEDSAVIKISNFNGRVDDVFQRRDRSDIQPYSGIGTKIQNDHNGYIINDVIKGSPAERSGLYQGDEIIEINGTPTETMDPRMVVNTLRGAAGTTVKIKIKPAGTVDVIENITVTRARISGDAQHKEP